MATYPETQCQNGFINHQDDFLDNFENLLLNRRKSENYDHLQFNVDAREKHVTVIMVVNQTGANSTIKKVSLVIFVCKVKSSRCLMSS